MSKYCDDMLHCQSADGCPDGCRRFGHDAAPPLSDRGRALLETMHNIRRLTSEVHILDLAEASIAAYGKEKGK